MASTLLWSPHFIVTRLEELELKRILHCTAERPYDGYPDIVVKFCFDYSPTTPEKLRLIRQWLDTTHDATVYDYIYRVNKGAGLNLFEGDIKGYSPRHHQLRTAVTNHQLLWNTRVVPLTIDSAFDSASRKEILAGIEEFHKKTCLRFVLRRSEADYIHIKQIGGCYSNVGRMGGEQELSLAGPCLKKGTAIHELMHALGFWHEQNRPDRDFWVQIIMSNIQTGKEYNFDRLSPNEVDTLNEQYDYGSIMHYSKYAFTKNGNPTIIPIRKTNAELGQREGLSEHDVHRINKLYRCGTYVMPSTTDSFSPPSQTINVTKPVTVRHATPKPLTTESLSFTPQTRNISLQTVVEITPPTIKSNSTSTVIQSTSLETKASTTTHPLPSRHVTHTTTEMTTVSSERPISSTHGTDRHSPPSKNVPTDVSSMMTTEGPSISIHSWTSWSTWSPCNLECKHYRNRFCLSYDSRDCPGNHSELRECPYSCEPAFSLGCWRENSESPFLSSVEGMDITLMDSYKERNMAVRKCADYAARNGYAVFAIFDDGMCRTGPSAYVMYSKGGPSRKCSYKGTGSEDANNVYSFVKDIDGAWSPWTSWSQCTKSCNIGQQYRFRSCDNPPPVGNGTMCPGSRREVSVCNLYACPINNKCGRSFYAGGPGDSGYIWVREYDNFMECEYHLTAVDPQSTISLLIQDMDVEYSKGCIYDSLMLYDGRNTLSPFVGAFCGKTSPGSFESSTNHAYLKFESDETKPGGGFTVFYTINNRSKKACVRPPPSPHVTIISEGNMVGNRVFYTCHHGYKLVGHPNITCVDQPNFALWDDVFPRCIASRKRSIWQENLCTFENSLCGFTPHQSSDFNWRVDQYADNSVLITKSSRLQAPGDVSRIVSREQDSGTEGNCLDFRYIIGGGRDAVLNVFLVQMNKEGGLSNTLVWSMHAMGDDDLNWRVAVISFETKGRFQIMFDAVLWEEIGSQVLIDDVRISPSKCSS